MSFVKKREQSIEEEQLSVATTPLPEGQVPFPSQPMPSIPRLSEEQLPFPEPYPEQSTPAEGMQTLAGPNTQALPRALVASGQTDQLERQTGTTSRQPIIIRGSTKKRAAPARSTIGRRLLIQLTVASMLIFLVVGVLASVTATNSQGLGPLGIQLPFQKSTPVKGNGTLQLAQQEATATAILKQPGYDPGPPSGYVPPGSDIANRFTYGQCTYWADERYFNRTGVRVPWMGNAYQWAAGASQYGWIVSSEPHVPSIIVLQPGVQYASPYYGHVAVVESINADGSVHTSNWNWGHPGPPETYVDFQKGSGVSFVWARGH